MGYIKEPKGVDFVIKSEPLTDFSRNEISNFIHNYKNKMQAKKSSQKTVLITKTEKLVHL